jgi:hypothetical protein
VQEMKHANTHAFGDIRTRTTKNDIRLIVHGHGNQRGCMYLFYTKKSSAENFKPSLVSLVYKERQLIMQLGGLFLCIMFTRIDSIYFAKI